MPLLAAIPTEDGRGTFLGGVAGLPAIETRKAALPASLRRSRTLTRALGCHGLRGQLFRFFRMHRAFFGGHLLFLFVTDFNYLLDRAICYCRLPSLWIGLGLPVGVSMMCEKKQEIEQLPHYNLPFLPGSGGLFTSNFNFFLDRAISSLQTLTSPWIGQCL